MTSSLRRAGLFALSLLLVVFSMVSMAGAQTEPGCYPVPPGGCEPTDELDCDALIAAIVAGDPEADLNGDGTTDAADLEDLPAECTCEALVAAVEAGVLDEGDLPEECVESEQIPSETPTEDPTEDPTEQQVADEADDEDQDGGETAVLADTGAPAAAMAALAALGLLGGGVLVRVGRRS